MSGEATTVGSIVAYLRMDDSDWSTTLDRAKHKAEDLGRTSPNISIQTNASQAIAALQAVRAAETQVTQGSREVVRANKDVEAAQNAATKAAERLAVANKALEILDARGGGGSRQQESTLKRVYAAETAVADAATRLASAQARLGTSTDGVATGQSKVALALATTKRVAAEKIEIQIETHANETLADLAKVKAEAIAMSVAFNRAQHDASESVGDLDDALHQSGSTFLRFKNIAIDAFASSRKSIREMTAAVGEGGTSGPSVMLMGVAAAAALAGPALGAVTAGAVELGGAVGVAALAYKGLRDEEDRQTATGERLQSLFHGIGGELRTLETIAANEAGPGVTAALGKVKAFLPSLDGPVAGLAKHLGNALNITTGGTITGLRVMEPLLDDAGGYAERLAQRLADFTASPEFAQFISYARQELPIVGHDLADVGSAFIHLGTALQPYGDGLLHIIDLTAQATTKTSDFLKKLNGNAAASGGDNSDFLGFQKRYQASKNKQDKSPLDYVNIALGAGDPYADSSKAKQASAASAQAAANAKKEAAARVDAAAAARAEQSTLQGLASQYGASVSNVQAAIAAEKQTAQQLALTTLEMQRQGNASGLLKASLDALDGKQLSAAEAQNAFEQSIVTGSQALESQKEAAKGQAASVREAATAVTGMSQAAIANRGSLLNQIQAAETAAGATGDLGRSSVSAKARLAVLRQQVIDNAVAHGADRSAVIAYIDTVLDINKLKVAPTKLDINKAAADSKISAFRAYVASLPGKTISINANTGSAIQQIGNLRTQIQQLNGKTVTITTNHVTHESVMKTQSGMTATTSARGNIFKAYAQGGKEDHQPQIASTSPGTVRVWAEPETGGEAYIPLANDGRRGRAIEIAKQTVNALGGHASFAGGGIVTLTPTKSSGGGAQKSSHPSKSTKTAKPSKASKPKQVIESLSVTAGGGQAYGLASYVRGQIPSAAGAMRLLSAAVNDAFTLKGVQTKIAAAKRNLASVDADLANVRQAKGQLSSGVNSTLLGGVDISKYGDAGLLNAALQTDTGVNKHFTAQLAKLKAEKVPTSLITRLAADGPSAGLDTIAGESGGALKKTLSLYSAYVTSAGKGGAMAGSVYDARIAADQKKAAADQKLIAGYTAQSARTESAMLKAVHQLAEITKRPVKVSVGGKEFARAVIDSGAVQGVMDDLNHTLTYGRR